VWISVHPSTGDTDLITLVITAVIILDRIRVSIIRAGLILDIIRVGTITTIMNTIMGMDTNSDDRVLEASFDRPSQTSVRTLAIGRSDGGERGRRMEAARDPVNLSPGIVELVGFTLNASGTTLAVYGSSISVNEVQPGGHTINMTLPVVPTALTLSQLDATTRCPNHRTVAVNSADQLNLGFDSDNSEATSRGTGHKSTSGEGRLIRVTDTDKLGNHFGLCRAYALKR
jgi:hypothetical protein